MRTLCKGEESGILKESDISRDEVPICVNRITSITPLKSRITQEDTFYGFGGELVLPRSKNMKKNRHNQRHKEEGRREVDKEK